MDDTIRALYEVVRGRKAHPQEGSYTCYPVSYTHLTLPTKRRV